MNKKVDYCNDCQKPLFVTFTEGRKHYGYMMRCDCVEMIERRENREKSISKILDNE